MTTIPASKGHLNPSPSAPVARLPPPAGLHAAVRHFWLPEWDLPDGVVMRQLVLTYPAVNLVVEPDGLALHGPSTRVSHRDLHGRGWAVGALLRPAAVPAFVADLRTVLDRSLGLDAPELVEAVTAAMGGAAPAGRRHAAARALLGDWIAAAIAARGVDVTDGLLANRLTDVIDAEPTLRRVDDVAARLGVSTRTLHRIAPRYTGFTPTKLIRRSRVQSVADALRADAARDIAAIAHSLGYADHAHLAREFRDTIGLTPSEYRRSSRPVPHPPLTPPPRPTGPST